jgi:hypothetical protein
VDQQIDKWFVSSISRMEVVMRFVKQHAWPASQIRGILDRRVEFRIGYLLAQRRRD